MPQAINTALVGHVDCPGGGQVWVEGDLLYVGHMRPPAGTTVVDVKDPRNPRVLAHIEIPMGWHSHKIRVKDGIALINHERFGSDGPADFGGGIAVYDMSRPDRPRQIGKWRTGGKGVHRFDFDGHHAYISPTDDGYVGNFVGILDLADPTAPQEVGRWWIPGQNVGGGETYPWDDYVPPRCHHPMRMATGSMSATGTTDCTSWTSRTWPGRSPSPM